MEKTNPSGGAGMTMSRRRTLGGCSIEDAAARSRVPVDLSSSCSARGEPSQAAGACGGGCRPRSGSPRRTRATDVRYASSSTPASSQDSLPIATERPWAGSRWRRASSSRASSDPASSARWTTRRSGRWSASSSTGRSAAPASARRLLDGRRRRGGEARREDRRGLPCRPARRENLQRERVHRRRSDVPRRRLQGGRAPQPRAADHAQDRQAPDESQVKISSLMTPGDCGG